MKKIFGAAAAALMATAAWAADPKSDTSSKDTNSPDTTSQDSSPMKDTGASKDTGMSKDPTAKNTFDLGSTGSEQMGGSAKATAKDQAAIKDVLNNLAKAFNSSDSKAAADLFAQDGVLIDPMGHKAVGRVDIEQQIGSNMKGLLKGTRMEYTNIEVKMVKPDVAYFDMDHQIIKTQVPTDQVATDQAAKQPQRIHVTGLLVKQGGKWLFEEARPGTYIEEQPTPAS
jgi:uncharacterized protein (TIGR02246 family)